MKAAFTSDGDVVVITGGANGIGAAVANAIAAAGGIAAVFDIAGPEESECVAGIEYHAVDVSDRDQVMRAVGAVVQRHGRVTGLVAAAAVQPRIPVTEMAPETWQQVISVNLDGVLWSAQAVLPHMVARRGGSIIFFTSGLATAGRVEASAYAATKGAMIPLAKSLAAEVVSSRVRVNVVAPGVIDTPQFRLANPGGGEREHWEKTTGIGVADDVIGPILFLLSDAATMTGSLLTRDRAF